MPAYRQHGEFRCIQIVYQLHIGEDSCISGVDKTGPLSTVSTKPAGSPPIDDFFSVVHAGRVPRFYHRGDHVLESERPADVHT